MNTPERVGNMVTGYLPACIFSEYEDYCPIIHVSGYPQENGQIRCHVFSEEVEVPPSKFIWNAGYLVLEIGSVEAEHTVSSAAEAVFESLNALFSACHDIVRFERIRTTVVLSEYLKIYRCNYSHIILIGHGCKEGIHFLDKSGPIRGNELAGLLGADKHRNPIQIISLCCHTGCEENAKALSNGEGVTEVIAPIGTFDLRWSVHFVLGYFLSSYLLGKNIKDAICDAALSKGSTPMTIWKDGEIKFRCST